MDWIWWKQSSVKSEHYIFFMFVVENMIRIFLPYFSSLHFPFSQGVKSEKIWGKGRSTGKITSGS